MNHLWINLTKDEKDLYTKNHKPLLREIKADLNKWRHIQCSWAGQITIAKVTIFHPQVQIPQAFLQKLTN